jgi:hypothetical protein
MSGRLHVSCLAEGATIGNMDTADDLYPETQIQEVIAESQQVIPRHNISSDQWDSWSAIMCKPGTAYRRTTKRLCLVITH